MNRYLYLFTGWLLLACPASAQQLQLDFSPLRESKPAPAMMLAAGCKEARHYAGKPEMLQDVYRFPGNDTLWTHRSLLRDGFLEYVIRRGNDSSYVKYGKSDTFSLRYRKTDSGLVCFKEEKMFQSLTRELYKVLPDKQREMLSRERMEYDGNGILKRHILVTYQRGGSHINTETDSVYHPRLKRLVRVKYYRFHPGSAFACIDCRKWDLTGKLIMRQQDMAPVFPDDPVHRISGVRYERKRKKVAPAWGRFTDIADEEEYVGTPESPEERDMRLRYERPDYLYGDAPELDTSNTWEWVRTDSCFSVYEKGRLTKTVTLTDAKASEIRYLYTPKGRLTAMIKNSPGAQDWMYSWISLESPEGPVYYWYYWGRSQSWQIYARPYGYKGDSVIPLLRDGRRSQVRSYLHSPASLDGSALKQLLEEQFWRKDMKGITYKYKRAYADSAVFTPFHQGLEHPSHHIIVSNDTSEKKWFWRPGEDTAFYWKYRPVMVSEKGNKLGPWCLRERRDSWEGKITHERNTYGNDGRLLSMVSYKKPADNPAAPWKLEAEIQKEWVPWKDTFLCSSFIRYFRADNGEMTALYGTRKNYKEGKPLEEFYWEISGKTLDTSVFQHVRIQWDSLPEGGARKTIYTSWKTEQVSIEYPPFSRVWEGIYDARGRPLSMKLLHSSRQLNRGMDGYWDWDATTGLLKKFTQVIDGKESNAWRMEYN